MRAGVGRVLAWRGGVADAQDRFDSTDRMVSDPAAGMGTGRPWLGVRFACSGAYVRVYRNAQGTEYLARCPRCAKCIRFRVGSGGTPQRFFEVSC
jgi:hypothetical protein